MHYTITPSPETKVLVRSINLDLTAELRNRATDQATRLLACDDRIRQIHLTLERDPHAAATQPFVAKGEVISDGPALFTSVTAAAPAQALDYLLEKLDHQLRRQRRSGRPDPSGRRTDGNTAPIRSAAR